jgi:molybdopterin synthase sulfur carrier subunit
VNGSSTTSVRVTALLFAQFRVAAGRQRIEVELDGKATVRSLAERLQRDLPLDLRGALCAVDERYSDPDLALHGGETVAFLPPVSGG